MYLENVKKINQWGGSPIS